MQAVAVGQTIIEKHEVDVPGKSLERFMRRTGFDDVKAVSFQSLGERPANQLLVIDDENRRHEWRLYGGPGSGVRDPRSGIRLQCLKSDHGSRTTDRDTTQITPQRLPAPSRPCPRCRTVFRPPERPPREWLPRGSPPFRVRSSRSRVSRV